MSGSRNREMRPVNPSTAPLEQLRSRAHAIDATRLEQRLQGQPGLVTDNEIHMALL